MAAAAGIFLFFAAVFTLLLCEEIHHIRDGVVHVGARVDSDIAARDAGSGISRSAARTLQERGHPRCVLGDVVHVVLQRRDQRLDEPVLSRERLAHEGGRHGEAALAVGGFVELGLHIHDGEESLRRARRCCGFAHDAEVDGARFERRLHRRTVGKELHIDVIRDTVCFKDCHQRVLGHGALAYAPHLLARKIRGSDGALFEGEHIEYAARVGAHELISRPLRDEVHPRICGHDDDVTVRLRHMRGDLVRGHDVDRDLIPRDGEGVLLRDKLRHRERGRAVGDVKLQGIGCDVLVVVAGGKPHREHRDERGDHENCHDCF